MRRLLICSSFCIAALAVDAPRRIDFTAPLLRLDGKPMRASDAKDAPVMTLGDAAVGALEAVTEEDRNTAGIDKFKRDQLARKVFEKRDAVLTVEEIALIKDRIGKVYAPSVIGAAWPMLDPSLIDKSEQKK